MTLFILKTIAFIIGNLPRSFLFILAKGLGRVAYLVDKRHRKVVMENLDRAFGQEKSPEEKRVISKKVFVNLAMNALEFMRIPWLRAEDLNGYVEFTGLEKLEEAHSRGKGLILYAAHFGNWELAAASTALKGYPMDTIVRELDSPVAEEFTKWARTRSGNRIVYKQRSMRKLLRTLAKNGIVGILLDQNVARSEGVFVDFFNTPACTNKGPALLAMISRAPVLPVFIIRKGRRHSVEVGSEIEVLDSGDRQSDVIENTRRFTGAIEDIIRRHPEQWFWVHRRWKTRPEEPWRPA